MTIKPVVMQTFEKTDAEGRTREITEVLDVDPNMTIQELAEKALAWERPAPTGNAFGDPRADDYGEPTLEPVSRTHLTIKVAQSVGLF